MRQPAEHSLWVRLYLDFHAKISEGSSRLCRGRMSRSILWHETLFIIGEYCHDCRSRECCIHAVSRVNDWSHKVVSKASGNKIGCSFDGIVSRVSVFVGTCLVRSCNRPKYYRLNLFYTSLRPLCLCAKSDEWRKPIYQVRLSGYHGCSTEVVRCGPRWRIGSCITVRCRCHLFIIFGYAWTWLFPDRPALLRVPPG